MNCYEITHLIENGRKVVQIPLSNSNRNVKLYRRDYLELEALGASLPWKWSQDCVYVRNNNRNVSIARLILDADKGQKVSYIDGNPYNLIRTNLMRIRGGGLSRARGLIVHKRDKPQITHKIEYSREAEDEINIIRSSAI